MTMANAPLSRDEAVALVRRVLDAANRRDSAAVAELYADDAVAVSPVFGEVRGGAAIAAAWGTLFSDFADLTFDVSTVLVDGSRVAVLGTVHVTDRVGWLGRAPTGSAISSRIVLLFTLANGRIVRDERIFDSAAVAERLEKVRLDKELRTAAAVQHALLPRTAQRRAFCESVGDSIACRAIGGDFFEFLELAGGGAVVVLGDVSGKGPAAALLAAMIQGIIAAEASSGDGPSAIVSRINGHLVARGLESRFATLVYGVLSPDGRFVYANAGHNPPMLVAQDGLRRLHAGGPIVGAFGGSSFGEDAVHLSDGDTLVMFSDGVTEALNAAGEEFGDDRLAAVVRRARAEAPGELLGRVLGAVREFCAGCEQTDDVTVTVTRYGAPSSLDAR